LPAIKKQKDGSISVKVIEEINMEQITSFNPDYSLDKHFRDVAQAYTTNFNRMLSHTDEAIEGLSQNGRILYHAYLARIASKMDRQVDVDLSEVILDMVEEFKYFDEAAFYQAVDHLMPQLGMDTNPDDLPL